MIKSLMRKAEKLTPTTSSGTPMAISIDVHDNKQTKAGRPGQSWWSFPARV